MKMGNSAKMGQDFQKTWQHQHSKSKELEICVFFHTPPTAAQPLEGVVRSKDKDLCILMIKTDEAIQLNQLFSPYVIFGLEGRSLADMLWMHWLPKTLSLTCTIQKLYFGNTGGDGDGPSLQFGVE